MNYLLNLPPLPICIVLFFLCINNAFSQTDLLLPVKQGDEILFYQTDGSLKFKISGYEFDKRFVDVDSNGFKDGLCMMRREDGDQYSHIYIDKSGKVVIDLKGNIGDHFSEGLAMVYDKSIKDKGYMDKTGAWAIPPKRYSEPYFSEGLNLVQYAREDSIGVIDKQGNILFKKSRKGVNFSPQKVGYSNGLALYKSGSSGYSYMNKKGEIVFEGSHSKSEKFSEGFAAIKIDYKNCSYLDTLGNIAISRKARTCESFSDGMAAVQQRGRWGYVDRHDSLRIPFEYREAAPFKKGYAVARKMNVWSIINKKGEDVFQDSLAHHLEYLGDSIVFVNYHGENNYAYYRLDGTLIVAPSSEYIQYSTFKQADRLPVKEIRSFSYHPLHKMTTEKIWGEPPFMLSSKKRRLGFRSRVFPEELLKYKDMEVLDLSYNQFDSLPSGICELKNLKELNLKKNNFTSFPEILNCMINLTKVDLSFNRIETLPDEGVVFKNIKELNVIATPIADDKSLLQELKKFFPNAKIISSFKSDLEEELKMD